MEEAPASADDLADPADAGPLPSAHGTALVPKQAVISQPKRADQTAPQERIAATATDGAMAAGAAGIKHPAAAYLVSWQAAECKAASLAAGLPSTLPGSPAASDTRAQQVAKNAVISAARAMKMCWMTGTASQRPAAAEVAAVAEIAPPVPVVSGAAAACPQRACVQDAGTQTLHVASLLLPCTARPGAGDASGRGGGGDSEQGSGADVGDSKSAQAR